MGFTAKSISLAVALAAASASFADENVTEDLYSNFYVFGDSLSDSGNAGIFTSPDPGGETPRQPAISFTAQRFGLPMLTPSCFGLGPDFGGAIPCAPAPGTPAEQVAQISQSLLANGNNWAVGGNRAADVLLDVVGPQRFLELFPDTTVADHNSLTTILPDSTRCGPDGICDPAAGESPYLPPAEVAAAVAAFGDPVALQALVNDPGNGIGLTGVPNASGQGFLQRNSIDSHALYYLNGGGNDIIAGTLAGTISPESMERAAGFLTFAVAELSTAGADYVVVSNVPRVGNTPLMNDIGPGAVSTANIGTSLYNEALRSQLVLLGANVLILDSAGLAALALDRPGLFGFADIDQAATCYMAGACANPDPVFSENGSAPNADRLYFNDGVHPTLAAQEVLGDYYYSVLSAPVGFGLLPDLGYQNYRTHQTNIDHHLVAQRFREPTTTIFFGGAWQRTELGGGPAQYYDDSAWNGLFGFSFNAAENFEWSLSLSYGSTEYTPDNLWLEADNLNFSWFARWNDERWFVDGGFTYSDIDYDEVDRRIHLGQSFRTRVQAGTEGDASGVFLRGGYDTAPALPCQLGPFVSVEWTEVEVDRFRERTDPDLRYVSSVTGETLDPIGLKVKGQDREYLRYRAGFFYNAPENAEWRWFGEVWVEGNDGDDTADVRVGLKSIRGNSAYLRAYDSDGRGFFQNGAGAMVGLNVTEKLQVSGNIMLRPEDEIGGLNINYRF
ncbi:autotransporter outer membrane beta-barrel domain-containing protein [Microbulbifer sp. YPW16]|uniref:autotransporter outer membrane beta-barrel domain-containing protein n=1 Tax=Microbulbifer sp. YPW16 TaxID=2904242 RepID=UPI001E46BB65|nr:autotransporter domain-containing protein [Microbulbifer sp. YPW16]UHQ54659.1 autotransporter domain-containing protein [Microbulbifer sp. YPW16]